MPIYEYECKKCGRRFEVLQKISDDSHPSCPSCSSDDVSRLISTAGFVLKGSGWYVTDYPSESRKKGLEKEKKSSDKSSEKKEKKAETSPKKSESKKPVKAE